MRVMALDCGTRRTGVAVCDELGISVRPVETIRGRNREEAISRAAAVSVELDITHDPVVDGLQRDLSRVPVCVPLSFRS